MTKSFKDYFGDFNAMRDKLLFAVGAMAQIPQKATNLIPAIERFMNSSNNALAATGSTLKIRAEGVRDAARNEYNKATTLMNEVLAFKDSVEKHSAFQTMMSQSKTDMALNLIGSFLNKTGDAKFFGEAVTKSVGYAAKSAQVLATLSKLSAEIKAVETLVSKTQDYAMGKGLLPVVDVPVGRKIPATKVMWVAGAGIVALGAAYLLRKKN